MIMEKLRQEITVFNAMIMAGLLPEENLMACDESVEIGYKNLVG